MKIEIIGPEPPFTRGYQIRTERRALRNVNGAMYPTDFAEHEIEYLLGEEYNLFEGGKFKFNVPKWKLDSLEGMMTSPKRYQLIYATNYQEL